MTDTSPAENRRFFLDLASQPTDTTCGPTCLQGIYRFYGEDIPLQQIIEEVPGLPNGGTLAVQLGYHALQRGYEVTLYTLNLGILDPTWFYPKKVPDMVARIRERVAGQKSARRKIAGCAYADFIELGGKVRLADLNRALLRKHLDRQIPIITGLSATWLYQNSRENPVTCADDDISGEPAGHFVILTGYHREKRIAWVADPYAQNPISDSQHYPVTMDHLINAILLGVLTYDANLLIIKPKNSSHAGLDCC